jgi:hypothetical protein
MPIATGDSFEVDATPVPVRYWWLKRLGAAAILFVLALIGLRIWWGHVAEARLQAKIAEYRAEGEPVLVEDFVYPPIPDAENGARFIQRAAAQMSGALELDDVIVGLRDGTLGAADAHAFLESYADPLQLAHEARLRTSVDWGVALTSPVFGTMVLSLAPQRELAKALCIAAHYEHAIGDDAAAVESLRDVLGLGRHFSAPQHFLIGWLGGVSMDSLAVRTIEEIATNLRVGEASVSADGVDHSAKRAQVSELIRELLDVAPLVESWKWAMQSERMGQLDAMHSMISGRNGTGLLAGISPPASTQSLVTMVRSGATFIIAPAWKLDAPRLMERCDNYLRAADQENWPAAQRSLLPDPVTVSHDGAAGIARVFSRMLTPSFAAALKQQYVAMTNRRFAATALAIRVYELEHGRRPAALADLVPEYLPAVPLDPLDPNDGPLRYTPDAPWPLLYSVGQNGIDEGGAFPVFADRVDPKPQDMPFFLDGDRPYMPTTRPESQPVALATQPDSAQALDHDGDVEGTQGNEGEGQRQAE